MRRPVLALAFILALPLAAGCSRKESSAQAAADEKRVAPAATVAGVLVPEVPAHGAPLRASPPGAGAPPAPVSAHTSEPEASQLSQMGAQHAALAGGTADPGDVKVPKAEGRDARTVAQVYAERLALKDKTVAVRGKVVKSSFGIMGRNWLHIRDGSGSREKKDDDLTVTTADAAAVGDVVLVRGVAHVDRDFGAGYAYPVVLEDAKITREPAPARKDSASR
jgi:hypothetical protein